LCLERATIAKGQGASEDQKFVANLSYGFILWRIAADFETIFVDFGTFDSRKHYGRAKIYKNCPKGAARLYERNP